MLKKIILLTLTMLLITTLLVACGGGGGTNPTQPTTEPTQPTAPAFPVVPTNGDTFETLDAFIEYLEAPLMLHHTAQQESWVAAYAILINPNSADHSLHLIRIGYGAYDYFFLSENREVLTSVGLNFTAEFRAIESLEDHVNTSRDLIDQVEHNGREVYFVTARGGEGILAITEIHDTPLFFEITLADSTAEITQEMLLNAIDSFDYYTFAQRSEIAE